MSKSSALAPAPSAVPAEQWKPPCVCIDIETPATGEAVLHKLAAFRPDTGAQVSFQGKFSAADGKAGLDALASGAELMLGYNSIGPVYEDAKRVTMSDVCLERIDFALVRTGQQ